MITVPEATQKIIERSRYLSEAMSKELINLSSLARYIKPELEEMLSKRISTSSIIMALKRLDQELKPRYMNNNIFALAPSMIIHSSLILITVKKDSKTQERLIHLNSKNKELISFGNDEITITISKEKKKQTLKMFKKDDIIAIYENLASLSISLPLQAQTTSGVLYFFLKSLAWEGINIVEVISTTNEFTLIVSEKDIHRTFLILQSLFS